ncbi:MAG TPA: hypothetical protein VIJ04_21520, partial [Xanthobacteraceae bacterium]
EAGERKVEDHGAVSLELIAGEDVGDRHGEEDKGDRQHDDVQHGNAPGKRCNDLENTYRRRRSLTYVNPGKVPPAARCVTIGVGNRDGRERNRIGIL